MMPAMMSPSLVALLSRSPRGGAMALVAAGYLGVWTAWGAVAWLAGAPSWAARLPPAADVAVLLVTGLMNVAAMASVTAAIATERLAPRPALVARAAGVVLIGLGARIIAGAVS
jgi:hypothetical protein